MSQVARSAGMVVLSISDVTTLSTAAIDATNAVLVMSYPGSAPFPATNNSTSPCKILLPSPAGRGKQVIVDQAKAVIASASYRRDGLADLLRRPDGGACLLHRLQNCPRTIPHDYCLQRRGCGRSEEHTSELQSLMRISYAVFCLKKKTQN